jgi:hypothetical protein
MQQGLENCLSAELRRARNAMTRAQLLSEALRKSAGFPVGELNLLSSILLSARPVKEESWCFLD